MSELFMTTGALARLPILILYPHSRCNCRCLMCNIWQDPVANEIALERLDQWIAEWQELEVRQIVLSGGEALMHSGIGDFLRTLHGAGFTITLLSTGLLFRRHATLIGETCETVIVSLDGPQEVHDRIRRVSQPYQKLADGVAALRRVVRSGLTISARCTVQRANCGHLRDTVAAAHALGLDRISFLAVDAHSDAFNWSGGRSGDHFHEVLPQGEDLEHLERELDGLEAESASDFASGFIEESPDKLRRRLLQYFRARAGEAPLPKIRCNAPWVSAVLESNGDLRPCFFHSPYGRLGPKDGFSNGLNTPEAIEFRDHLDVATNALCQSCVCNLALRNDELPQ